MRCAWWLAACMGCASAESEPNENPVTATCAEGEYALPDGRCFRPGVPVDGCAPGFVHDGVGCEVVLPAEACPPGQLAVPGESVCHEPAPCEDGPVDAMTVFVDASYANSDSDGSAARPFRSIQAGVDAALAGGTVAIAPGSYFESVELSGKSLTLWGRCPALVEMVGVSAPVTLSVIDGASDSRVRGIAVTGGGLGIAVSGVEDVSFEGIWVHDTANVGLQAEETLGLTSMALTGSLVEGTTRRGVVAIGASVRIGASLIRDVRLQGTTTGLGVLALADIATSRMELVGSVVERTYETAVGVQASELVVDGSVVRDTWAGFDQPHGRGIQAHDEGMRRATLTVRKSLVERNVDAGILTLGADALIENTVVRFTAADAMGRRGVGIGIENDFVYGPRSTGLVRASVLHGNQGAGVLVIGSDATVEDSVTRDGHATAAGGGRGIQIEEDPDAGERATAALRRVVSRDNMEVGVFAIGADVTLEDSVITRTAAVEGIFGDGAVALSIFTEGSLSISNARIDEDARVGVGAWGSRVSISGTSIRCNSIDLNGEPHLDFAFHFEDLGDNHCGCAEEVPCKQVTSGLAPPLPLP